MIFSLLANLKPYNFNFAGKAYAYCIINFILVHQPYSDPFWKSLVIASVQTQISVDDSTFPFFSPYSKKLTINISVLL